MYKIPHFETTSVEINDSVEGETLETKLERIIENKEPIENGAPIIFTDRKEGVKASTNIRTDRFEIAIDGMDVVQRSYQARREEKGKVVDLNKTDDGGAEPIQGTN